MNILVPCGGLSTRYPGQLPKYLWPVEGRLMIEETLASLLPYASSLSFAVLNTHEQRWQASALLRRTFAAYDPGILVLPQVTRGPAATVDQLLDHQQIEGPFFIKDCDSAFLLPDPPWPTANGVCCGSIADYPHLLNLNAKSYLQVNDQGLLVGLVEKQMVSGDFGCGGYYFQSADEYRRYYAALPLAGSECYVSQAVEDMLAAGLLFYPIRCREYRDFGTFESWEWSVSESLKEDKL